MLPLNADNGPPVFYGTVTEYTVDTDAQHIGKTVLSIQFLRLSIMPPGILLRLILLY